MLLKTSADDNKVFDVNNWKASKEFTQDKAYCVNFLDGEKHS